MAEHNVQTSVDRGRAGLYLATRNAAIITRMGAKRQGIGAGSGERAPLGMAARPVALHRLTERTDSGATLPKTAPGTQTAIRNSARALAVLASDDPRRIAADLVAGSYEQIGAAGGGRGGGGDTSGGVSDGGVTTRIKHVERIRLIEALANGWAVDPVHGRVKRGPERVALTVQRKRPGRLDIKAFRMLILLCVEGRDMAQILTAHGWNVHSKHSRVLIAAAWQILDDIAEALGFGRSDAPRGPCNVRSVV